MKSLAIVLPHYGGVDITWRCLTHLWLFAPEARLIVVDDASPDNLHTMREFLELRGVTYHRHEENRGVTAAWNTGVRLALGADLIGFINNDAAVMPGCVSQLVWAAGSSEVVCAVTYSTGKNFDVSKFIDKPVAERVLTPGFMSTFFVVERGLGERLGWFDESMRMQFSDTDFSLRAARHATSLIAERAVVYHALSMSCKRNGVEKTAKEYLDDRSAFRRKWINGLPENIVIGMCGYEGELETLRTDIAKGLAEGEQA